MASLIAITLGGLTKQYYFRNFFFGVIFAAIIFFIVLAGKQVVYMPLALAVINTILYPYARFVYESIVEFIIGNNQFWLNAYVVMYVKAIMMAVLWSFAIFIAPIGLLYLFFKTK